MTKLPKGSDEIDTPAVLVDLDAVDRNLQRFQQYCDQHRLKLRPHIKTHKIVAFARQQLELGAVGITCQKLGEAEVMADAGIRDIFLPYNLYAPSALARAVALARKVRLSLACDNPVAASAVSRAFAAAGLRVPMLVECDSGGARCGVQTPADALELAAQITRMPGLRFEGLMTYPAAGKQEQVARFVAGALALFAEAGVPVNTVSSGGTPDLWHAGEVPGVTEYRAGTYIYHDKSLMARGVATEQDCALRVLATVTSRPAAGRAIIDAGSKALSSDAAGQQGFGHVCGFPDAVVHKLNEEHGYVDISNCRSFPGLGERIALIPNHACAVSNLFDSVHAVRDGAVLGPIRVDARGRSS